MFKNIFQCKWGAIACFHSLFDNFTQQTLGAFIEALRVFSQAEIFEDESSFVYKKKGEKKEKDKEKKARAI